MVRHASSGEDAEGNGLPTRRPIHRAVQAPEVKAKLAVLGLYPVGMCGANFAALIRGQYEDFDRVIREANIKAE
jgi:tripartite-type tricarboxylate transporter receptor subunit TctC